MTDVMKKRTLDDEIEAFEEMKARGVFKDADPDAWVAVYRGEIITQGGEFGEVAKYAGEAGILGVEPVLIRQVEKKPVFAPFMVVDRDRCLENVREFHKAFSCHIADAPGFPELSENDMRVLRSYALELVHLGLELKGAAQLANTRGRTGLGLMLIRLQLLTEETGELAQAMAEQDMVEALDAMADIDYVCNGTWFTLGLQDLKAAACQAVHDSNMSKLGADGKPIISEAGRVVKGPGYKPPTEALRALLDKNTA